MNSESALTQSNITTYLTGLFEAFPERVKQNPGKMIYDGKSYEGEELKEFLSKLSDEFTDKLKKESNE